MNRNLLRYYIAEAGLTYKELEKILGMSHTAFYRKMSGKVEFRLSEIRSIIKILKIDDIKSVFFND